MAETDEGMFILERLVQYEKHPFPNDIIDDGKSTLDRL